MKNAFQQLRTEIGTVILGQSSVVEALLVALLAEGHVILEGVPGTAKTLLVKLFSTLIQGEFRRVQLTPDVLPADVLGTSIFDLASQQFILRKGPIFTQILLADEINRTPPKTQAALLEAMEERQVTLDGETLPLSPLFWTIATQNPLEFEGTYPLPEAQLDRFLFKMVVDYPNAAAEKQMLANILGGFEPHNLSQWTGRPILDGDRILAARQEVRSIHVEDSILDYLLNLVTGSRSQPELLLGASPRAAVGWLRAAQAKAWLDDRTFVTPDDIKGIALPLLRHRFILKPEAQLDGISVDRVIRNLLSRIPVPR
ncbi:AAA family ATPase [Altericista sp. CCNU0014]|uniref:AAA family ATPase n=1 Tax=Altericista sp. CCNU0014 TaxID=3082949 RepID=UPI00384F1DC0